MTCVSTSIRSQTVCVPQPGRLVCAHTPLALALPVYAQDMPQRLPPHLVAKRIARQMVSAVMTIILALTLFPEEQQRAQEELDRVVGEDRLPNFEDKENLPFCCALFKECFR